MRQKAFNFSHKKAFSLFELVLLFTLFALLLTQALPRFTFNQTRCLHQLNIQLSQANDAFLDLYTQSILQSHQPRSIAPILEELTQSKDQNCFFEYKNGKLIGHIGKKTLSFEISPNDFKSKPKIYCSVSNPLCRMFWQKTMKK